MTPTIEASSWSEAEVVHGLAHIAQRVVSHRTHGAQNEPSWRESVLSEHLAETLGLELEPVRCGVGELSQVLPRLAPALVRVPAQPEPRYLIVLGSSSTRLDVLTPRLARRRVTVTEVVELLAGSEYRSWKRQGEDWFAALDLPLPRSSRPLVQLGNVSPDAHAISGIWLLRLEPGTHFGRQLWHARVPQRVLLALALALVQLACTVGAWLVLSRAIFQARLDSAWLFAFALAWLSTVPLSCAMNEITGHALRDGTVLLKRRLLCGALRLDPAVLRARGSGRLLALVSETSVLEAMVLHGAFPCVLSLLQLASAFGLLVLGAGGSWHVALLAAWCGLVAWLGACNGRKQVNWAEQRFELAQTFMEHVAGHRTRAIQRPAHLWHVGEDHAHAAYLEASRSFDASSSALAAAAARGWLVVAACSLVPLVAAELEPAALALTLGGTLQAYTGLAALAAQAGPLGAAWIAWTRISELYHAASQRPQPSAAGMAVCPVPVADVSTHPVLDVRGVSFGYRCSTEPVLRNTSISLQEGDRLLLLGASGAGKSTLGAVLLGLCSPWSGQVLLRGLDRPTLGPREWRRRIVGASQFHENHVFSGTLAFNLLLGRSWPPSEADLAEAETVCFELGLGALVERMPAGLHQVVGETGWQLSHGERGRIFLARALLQNADVVILDESFGALDPLTLRTCMSAVLRRARTLLVIAHP